MNRRGFLGLITGAAAAPVVAASAVREAGMASARLAVDARPAQYAFASKAFYGEKLVAASINAEHLAIGSCSLSEIETVPFPKIAPEAVTCAHPAPARIQPAVEEVPFYPLMA